MGPPLPPPVMSDKTRFNQVCHKTLPLALRPAVPKPLVVTESTWVIRGKDNTYLGFAFGDGRQVRQINLYDHLPADRVPHLSNYVLSLTGTLPDAIGIDIGFSAGASVFTAMGGVNILWHTRGEGQRAGYPELHVYHGGGLNVTWAGIGELLKTPPNAAGAVQVILAWATVYDANGRAKPASNSWVANGFNWTGYFWSWGFSFPIPVPPFLNLVGSYF